MLGVNSFSRAITFWTEHYVAVSTVHNFFSGVEGFQLDHVGLFCS